MLSKVRKLNNIEFDEFLGEFSMIKFDLETLKGVPDKFLNITNSLLLSLKGLKGQAYLTVHGKFLKKNETLRRPGPHTDGNYDLSIMAWSGGGWKVNEDSFIAPEQHELLYHNKNGGVIFASSEIGCSGYVGGFDGFPKHGGDCSHIELNNPFLLEKNTVYYGNNHFIHESLPVPKDCLRVFARITLPINHEYRE